MKYDVIIAGAGPAGLSCGLRLARAGKRCLILEKREQLTGKVCGDGLSSHCMEVLKTVGISEEDLAALGGKKIRRNVTSSYGRLEQRYYRKSSGFEDYAWGLSRDVFDPWLLSLVRASGGEVRLGCEVSKIEKRSGGYVVNEAFFADCVVIACGAAGGARFGISRPADLPVGMSARVWGDCNLAPDAFYFKYDWQYGKGYAWLFPVGERLWNYGVWSAEKRRDIKRLFFCLEERLSQVYFSEMHYERQPGGALIGATRRQKSAGAFPRIGDCAFEASYVSGEGISFAIESGWQQATAILENREAKRVYMPEKWAFGEEMLLPEGALGNV